MILTEKIKTKMSGNNIHHYKELGYNVKFRDEIEIPIEHLPKNSGVKILAKCDCCGKTKKISYCNYNIIADKHNGYYYCKKCSLANFSDRLFEERGVRNVRQLPEIKEKAIKSSLERYGYENPAQSPEIRRKIRNVFQLKYGVDSAIQVPMIQEKIKNTLYSRYNVYNASQIPGINEKKKNSYFNKTGYEYSMQNPEVKEQVKITNNLKYGCDYPMQNDDVKQKTAESFYLHSSQKCSKQQKYFYDIIKQHYPQAELNYPISQYSGDIVIDNLNIEIDYGGHNLGVKLGSFTQEEFDQKELIRDKIVKSQNYKVVRIKSYNSRKVPIESKLLEILSYTIDFFNFNPDRSWITFDIDNSCIYNAYHKDGIPFDFGELKTIRNSNKPISTME